MNHTVTGKLVAIQINGQDVVGCNFVQPQAFALDINLA
jgi:hypothetical protein